MSEKTIQDDDLLKNVINEIDILSLHLNTIHIIYNNENENENEKIDNILKIFKDLCCNIDDYDPIIYFLDIIIISKLQNILDIVYILEKKTMEINR